MIVLQYFIEVKTCSKGNYIQGRISIPEDVDKIEILLSDKNSKDHPHFLMIFPTNRNGIKLKEPKEDDKRIFIVRKEFEKWPSCVRSQWFRPYSCMLKNDKWSHFEGKLDAVFHTLC